VTKIDKQVVKEFFIKALYANDALAYFTGWVVIQL